MTRRPINRIFLSSSLSLELQPLRASIKRAIDDRSPYEIEYRDTTTGAGTADPVEESLKRLRDCDFCIILLHRTIGPVTREEWREAIRLKMHRHVYFSTDTTPTERHAILDSVLEGLSKKERGLTDSFDIAESRAGENASNILLDLFNKERELNEPSSVASDLPLFAIEIHQYLSLIGSNVSSISADINNWGVFTATDDAGEGELVACQASQVTLEGLERVVERARDQGLHRFRVVTDTNFPSLLRARAEDEGGQIQLVNDMLMELTDIEEWLKDVESEISALAVNERYVELSCKLQILDRGYNEYGEEPVSSVHDYIDEWINHPNRPQLAILGEFGTGKSWLCLYVANVLIRKLRQGNATRLPLFVQLGVLRRWIEGRRTTPKASSNDDETSLDLVAYIAERLGLEKKTRRLVELLSEYGRFLVILDGLDEIVPTFKKGDFSQELNSLTELSKGQGKTLLTSRRGQFSSLVDETRELNRGGAHRDAVRFEIIYLSNLNLKHIRKIVENRFGRLAPRYLERIEQSALRNLVTRPIVLDMALDILMEIPKEDSIILFDIYERCTRRWLKFAGRPTSPLTEDQRLLLVQRLAWELYNSQERDWIDESTLDDMIEDVTPEILQHFNISSFGDVEGHNGSAHGVRSYRASEMLLVRDNQGKFAFAHRSFMEFLVAKNLLEAIRRQDGEMLGAVAITDAILTFLRDQALDAHHLKRWLDEECDGATDWRAGNLLTLLHAMKAPLAGSDFSGLCIKGAILEGADLRNTKYRAAELHRLRIGGADLSGADLRDANVSGLILGVKSSAKTIACSPVEPLVAACNALNEIIVFVPQDDEPPTVLGAHDDSVTRIAFSPDGRLIGSVAFDHKLKIWDVRSRRLLRELPLGASTTYCVSLDLQQYGVVLTGGNDKSVRSWSLADGSERLSFTGHEDTVYDIAGNAAHRRFATASFDGRVISYILSESRLGFRVERTMSFEHPGEDDSRKLELVNGVALDPAGETLACCDNDGRLHIRRWRLSGEQFSKRPTTFKAHESQVWSVAFSGDGAFAVTASSDRTVAIWDCRQNWRRVATLNGHEGAVWQAAFVAGGELVASSSNDSTIRVWNWRQEREVHQQEVGKPMDHGISCDGAQIGGVRGLSKLQVEFLRNLGAR